jgi:hypothetical protein
LTNHPHAHINPAPTRAKRFHVEHMRRIPVMVSDEAKEVLNASSYQGRVLPQALSEFFGTHPEVYSVEVDLEEDRLMIHIKHGQHEDKHHRFFIAVGDLIQTSERPRQGFEATRTADELLRLYRLHVLKEK